MYSVFLSVPSKGFEPIRGKAIKSIVDTDCFPFYMGNIKYYDENFWETIKKQISLSDFFIIILGDEYGSINKTIEIDKYGEMSYTEMELCHALEKGIPIIPLIKKENNNKSTTEEGSNNEKLKHLKNELRFGKSKQVAVVEWENEKELLYEIKNSLFIAIKSLQPKGWYRADGVRNIYMDTREKIDSRGEEEKSGEKDTTSGLRDFWKDAEKIEIANLACQSIISPKGGSPEIPKYYKKIILEKFKEGVVFYFLLTNPYSMAAYDAAEYKILGDGKGEYNVEGGSFGVIPDSVNRLIKLIYKKRKKKKQIKIRLADFVMPYAIMKIKYKEKSKKSEKLKVDLYSFGTIDKMRPSFIIDKSEEPELFKLFSANFDTMWKKGKKIDVKKFIRNGIEYKILDRKKIKKYWDALKKTIV